MKKLFLALLTFILFSSINFAQPALAPKAVIAAEAVSIVYIGLENPINVSVPGYQFDQIELKTDFGLLTKKDGQYFLSVNDSKQKIRKLTISVFIKEDLKLTPAGKKEFNILRVPNPTPVLNGYAGGEIRQAKLKDMDSVYVDMDWFYYRDILFQVTSFEIIIQKKDNTNTSYQHKGTQLSQEVKEVIYGLEAGSVIIVSRIFADIATKGNRQLPGSIVLSVIE